MNVIETQNLTKKYGNKVVLDNVNFCLKEGEIYGLVGRNGAGKTTLIREILGLATPTSGTVAINGAMGQDALAYERKKIGSLIDYPALIKHMSAYENMKAAALQFGCYDDLKIKEILHKVGLNADDSLKVKNFSLGMKQRLAIGITLLGNPSVLILDEPVNGLDPTGIFEVRELVQRLNREDKVTILISSHLLGELSRVATTYGVMEGGKLIKEMRGADLEEMCRPYIKVAVEDMKIALRVVVDNYHAHDYEILPYNTLALYDLSRPIPEVVKMFSDANVKIGSITECQGDLESTFIALMGGLHNENEQ